MGSRWTHPRRFVLLSTAAVICGAAPSFAQTPDVPPAGQPGMQAVPDPTAGDLDPHAPREAGAIIVTGSRIARRDLGSTSPLAVVQDEEFRLSGTVNVEQVLNQMPQVTPVAAATAFSNNPGNGTAQVDLRGLGSTRTLVLVNGRRWMNFGTTQVVDLNTIPAFLVDSVDVVTGGASAVYGSDALAGVVNFRMRTDLQGLVAGGTISLTEAGDGLRWGTHVAVGAQMPDGRGHVAAFAEYFNRGQVMQGDRGWSRFALGESGGSLIPLGSSLVPQGRHVAVGGAAIGEGTRFAGLGASFDATGNAVPYVGAQHSHNYAPENYLMVPQERWLIGGYGEYEITPEINLYTEVAFINNRVANELAATPIQEPVDFNLTAIQGHVAPGVFAELQTIAARQQAANLGNVPGTVRLQTNYRTMQVGSRNALDERNSWRTLVGLRGNVIDDMSYDLNYYYSRTRNSQIQEGNISRSAYNAASASGLCNVFGPGRLSPECVQAISILAQNTVISELQGAQASIASPLFNFGWGADDVGLALGIEWRRMAGQFIPDTALASGDVVGFNAGQPTQGAYDVREVFGELRVPLLQDMLIHRLELTGAARYSDYGLDNVGGVWTYAIGAEFAPIRDITFRGQYQRSVRAPNVNELFGGQSIGFPSATDPCGHLFPEALRTEAIRQLCVATGVPAGNVWTNVVQTNQQIQGIFGGNPNLQEEVSDTWTVGAILRPGFIPRLNIALDYYNITIDGAISEAAGGVNNILNLCYTEIQDVNHPLCRAIARDPTTGEIRAPYVVTATQANLGGFDTSGIDFQVDYSLPLNFGLMGAAASRLNFYFMGTWLEKWNFTPVQGLPVINECGGRFGQTCGTPRPEWAWTTRATWIDGPLTTSLRWRHAASVVDDNPDVDFVVERIPAHSLWDLSFGFDVNDNLTLTMGVNNLFGTTPPIMGNNASQANTYPGFYDPLGRDFFISANLRF